METSPTRVAGSPPASPTSSLPDASSDSGVPPLLDMRANRTSRGTPLTRERRDRMRLGTASWAFTTRRVPMGAAAAILPPSGKPEAGDVVLARIDSLGQHVQLHLVNGRRRQLFPGDEVVIAYGNRYASNQFEAVVPETLGPCHLVAGGGIASRARSWHSKITRGPTHITPIGLLGDAHGRTINLRQYALEPVGPPPGLRPTPIVVLGTSMDSGKTQTCVHLVRGLAAAGLRVGYAKVTGTGAGGDYWWMRDAGASPVLDFTDAGKATTYMLSPDEVEHTMVTLMHHVAHHGVDAMVLEIADGVLQRETAALIERPTFHGVVGGVVLAAQDAMGAVAGISALRGKPTPVLALSGVLTASPLQVLEASQATGLPIYDREGLMTASVAVEILGQAQRHVAARRIAGHGAA